MTKSEIKVLIQWATANFPNMQERDMRPTAALWEKMLADMPYEVAEKALMKVLATAKFFPTVAEIRAAAVEITQPAMPTAAEAWGEVVQAIRRYGYYQEADAMASLSPAVAQVVSFIGWRNICASDEPEIIRAQFRKAYETQSSREKEMAQIPSDVRQLISSVVKALPSFN
jgi:hypothetical protein